MCRWLYKDVSVCLVLVSVYDGKRRGFLIFKIVIAYFTVLCFVTDPLSESEAGMTSLIQTLMLFKC